MGPALRDGISGENSTRTCKSDSLLMSLAISIQNVSKLYRLGEISRGQLLADLHRWWVKEEHERPRRIPRW